MGSAPGRNTARGTPVAMLTHSYYLSDPRVRREAETLARAGYEVDVICLGRPGEPPSACVDGVTIFRLPVEHRRTSKARYALGYLASLVLSSALLARLHLRRRYRVVQVHTPPDFLVFAASVPKLTGARIVLDMHDPMPETIQTKFGLGPRHWLWRLMALQESLSAAFADHVITVTDQVRDAFIGRGIAADKISIVMNLADPSRFPRVAPSASRQRPPDGPTLVFMGTLTRQYGVDLLIEAVAILRREFPAVHLKVIGDGEEKPALIQQARRLGMEQRVSFIPRAPITSLAATALPADIGIAPHRVDTLYDMCFPSKIYDYLMLGLPVVAARTRSLEHYYGPATLAYFRSGDPADLAAAVGRLVREPERVAALRTETERFLRARNWAREQQGYLDLVARHCARGAPRTQAAPRPAAAREPERAVVRASSCPTPDWRSRCVGR